CRTHQTLLSCGGRLDTQSAPSLSALLPHNIAFHSKRQTIFMPLMFVPRSRLLSLFSALLAGVCFLTAVHPHAPKPDSQLPATEGILAYRMQHYKDALRLLRTALEFHQYNARALYYLGLTHLALGQVDRAVPPLERLHELRPDDLDTMYQLGGAYFALAQYDKAEPLLEEAFRRQPDLEHLGYYVGFLRDRHTDF